jgi:hypothetical protein
VGVERPQISPLRFAPVEMTKGGVIVDRIGDHGKNRPQISPLRFAPVEMTKGGVIVDRIGGPGMMDRRSLHCASLRSR